MNLITRFISINTRTYGGPGQVWSLANNASVDRLAAFERVADGTEELAVGYLVKAFQKHLEVDDALAF